MRRFLKTTLYFPVFFLLALLTVYLIFISPQVRQVQTRQQARLTSVAQSLGFFLDLSQTTLVLLGSRLSDDSVPLTPDYLQGKLDNFVASWQSTAMVEAVFVDTRGRLLVVANDPGYRRLESIDVSDREYFTWSQTAKPGETYVGLPIRTRAGAFRDQYIIPVATPVFRDGQFAGTLAMAISIKSLAESLLEPLKLTESSRIYLVDARGILLYSPFPELQNIDYLQYLDEHPFPGSQLMRQELQKRAQSYQPGTLQVILPNMETKWLSLMIIAHQPIISESGHWLVAMATPLGSALKLTAVFFTKQLLAVLFLVITIFLFRRFITLKPKKRRVEVSNRSKKN